MRFYGNSRWAAAVLALGCGNAALAAAPPTITQAIDDQQTVILAGNTRPEARTENDRGALPADVRLDHLQLLLKRPAGTQAGLTRFIGSLTDRASPNYQHWLTAAALGETYGPAASDIEAVTRWLTAHGFTVNGISSSRMTIDFSGTAGDVATAFHTEIHRLDVRGVGHIANTADPRIPAALAGVVAGITSLNDFRPHPDYKPRPAYTASENGNTVQAVVPADLAKIYNFTPAFSAGITGTGQTVVVIEDTNVHSTADWTTFRSTFGLSAYKSGSFKQVHPAGSNACANPGTVAGNEAEAELDAEWASAAAPNAAIELASCADTSTNFGGLLALQNLIDGASPPPIVSISYGECEAFNGATANAAFYTTYEQAASEGISVFVSAGDEGAASCDADQAYAQYGIAVSGFATTPYNVAVGGTDFGDAYARKVSTYWGTSNGSYDESAKSYIPEIPWNDSCASRLLALYYSGSSTTYGNAGFCNSATGQNGFITTAAGSGGPSRCATGAPSISGVVSGTCKGYAKPSWQSLVGNPADKVRDIPDVSLFAADGAWNHFYIYCDSDLEDSGAACTGAPINWSGAGGTSFASPIMAGIQALVNQHKAAKQGNPNPIYYQLAATEYGTAGNANCSSTLGKSVSSACIFYDTTLGDMDVPCYSAYDCYDPGSANGYGVLSTSDSSYKTAYGTGTGWDFATGIGSVNVYNLVEKW